MVETGNCDEPTPAVRCEGPHLVGSFVDEEPIPRGTRNTTAYVFRGGELQLRVDGSCDKQVADDCLLELDRPWSREAEDAFSRWQPTFPSSPADQEVLRMFAPQEGNSETFPGGLLRGPLFSPPAMVDLEVGHPLHRLPAQRLPGRGRIVQTPPLTRCEDVPGFAGLLQCAIEDAIVVALRATGGRVRWVFSTKPTVFGDGPRITWAGLERGLLVGRYASMERTRGLLVIDTEAGLAFDLDVDGAYERGERVHEDEEVDVAMQRANACRAMSSSNCELAMTDAVDFTATQLRVQRSDGDWTSISTEALRAAVRRAAR